MMIPGQIFYRDGFWVAWCEALGAFTQGDSHDHAKEMLAECIEMGAERPDLKVMVIGDGERVSVAATRPALLVAELLSRQRDRQRLTPEQVADRVPAISPAMYRELEAGTREPTMSEFTAVLAVIAPTLTLKVTEPESPIARAAVAG